MAKKKDKKAKKHDPSEKKEQGHLFFNVADHKIIRQTLPKELNKIADKYNVAHIDLENSPPYPDDWFARDWSWRSAFFIKDLEGYEDTIDYSFVDHHRFYLDRLIGKCYCMVWNLVIKTIKKEYKKTNVIPKSPLSKKKGRDSIEAVAEYYADKEAKEFEEMFK